MLVDVQQGEMFGLPVDIYQIFTNFAQQAGVHTAPIDAGNVAPVGADFARQGDITGFVQQLFAFQDGLHSRADCLGDAEGGFHAGALGTGPHLGGIGAPAQHSLDGVDDDRLTCAGLASEGDQAGLELHVQPVDNGKVLNMQLGKHYWIEMPPRR